MRVQGSESRRPDFETEEPETQPELEKGMKKKRKRNSRAGRTVLSKILKVRN